MNFNNHCGDTNTSFGRDIPRILWKLDVHRCIRRHPPPVLILRQIYLARVSLSYVWKIILTSSFHLSLGLPSGLFSSGFPTKIPHAPLLCSLRATSPAYLIPFDLITLVTFGVQHTSYSSTLYGLLHSPVTSSFLGTNIFLRKLFSKNPQPTFLPQCDRPSDIVTLRCLVTVK